MRSKGYVYTEEMCLRSIFLSKKGSIIPAKLYFLSYCVSHCFSRSFYIVNMDFLITWGINTDLRPTEFEDNLHVFDNNSLFNVRALVFQESKAAGLAVDRSSLVQRKKTNGGKSIRQKHVADIVQLVRSIKNKTPLPRILLKNGKRSAEQWLES